MSARGDRITWLHEGDSGGPGGSAGLQAMQVLKVTLHYAAIMHYHTVWCEAQPENLFAAWALSGSGHVHRAAWHADLFSQTRTTNIAVNYSITEMLCPAYEAA